MWAILTQYYIMKKISCAILTGDTRILKEITQRINFFDSLEITNIFNNHIEMIETLNKVRPGILFICVDNARFNVLETLKLVDRPPFIFAITSNKLRIPELLDNGFFDYLSPKLDLETFCKKMSKVLNIYNSLSAEPTFLVNEPKSTYRASTKKKPTPTNVFLKYKKTQSKLAIEDIALIMNTPIALKVETIRGKVAYHNSTLKKFGQQLPEDLFIRINKSVIVNVMHIEKMELNTIYIRKKAFKVSRLFAPALRDFVRQNSIGKVEFKKKNPVVFIN